ncbi:hybrid sensor histidine kinase/response regulator [Synechocystis sp. CACIAM 05]|uniref:hybrid sensor histidine kinase/response regulator n=1 Tax=Synechocystis sp. CACIAM 05 TaxID=1933929 RepID=UPI00138E784B|nr:hybrid sensor histidine kinase/response regulator [Synechocystis sp. CACIAM 05]QHV01459.1 hybrid sensor histidine kinase/response regulator [Synechocystis sp. CACIAM 05]
MKTPSIMVVDDESDNFDVIEALLSDQGYQLYYAANGQEAIESIEIYQSDLVLLDVMMPGMDGIEVCRRLKSMARWKSVPIIMVTALTAKEQLAHCLEMGADDFMSKPINGMELRARVKSMLRIKKQYDDLEELMQQRQEMVAMVMHDLRNPLTSICIGLELLEHPKISAEKQKEISSRLQESADRLKVLIDDFLAFAKVESGKILLHREEILLTNFIFYVIQGFEALSVQRGIKIISQIPNSDSAISADVAMFRRVLENLLSNAIKFSPPDSKVLVKVDISEPQMTKIQILDQGPGVPPELKEKIFGTYEIGLPIKDVPQIGLGLAFCKLVIENHGGVINITDNQPTGSIFEICLPR